jgi:hypothetical protein
MSKMNIEVLNLNSRIVSQVKGGAVLNGSVSKRSTVECRDVANHGYHHQNGIRLRLLRNKRPGRSECPCDGNSSLQQIR